MFIFLRIVRIFYILGRHDALWMFRSRGCLKYFICIWMMVLGKSHPHLSKGMRLSNALTDLGPIFIKLGQILSVRPDIVGDDIARELSSLQDNLPPFHTKVAIKTIEEQFKCNIADMFKDFQERAVAAASIAQIHRATTLSGDDVAVKILRPNIEKIFSKDIALLKKIAHLIEKYFKKARRLRPLQVVMQFEKWMQTEMNLTLEAASATQLADNFKGRDEKFRIAKIYWSHTSRRVLTSGWIDGFRIDDVEGMKNAGIDPKEILKNASHIFFLQIFDDGFFHADMHPGNIFVDKNGCIVPIDFGIMGHIDREAQLFLGEILIGFLHGDYRRVADAHFAYGIVPAHHSRHEFALAMRAIGEPFLGYSLNDISVGQLLGQLFRTTEEFEMPTQPQLLLLQKTLLMAEGVGRMLDDNVNIWLLSEDLIEEWVALNMGPTSKILKMAALFLTLPDIFDDILQYIGQKMHEDNDDIQKQ